MMFDMCVVKQTVQSFTLSLPLILVLFSRYFWRVPFWEYYVFSLLNNYIRLCISICHMNYQQGCLLGNYTIIDRYEGALDPWMSSLWNILYQRNHRLIPNAATPETSSIDQPKVQVIYHDSEEMHPPVATSTGKLLYIAWFSMHNT